MDQFGIYSAGGFAREVKGAFCKRQETLGARGYEVVFIDDDPTMAGTTLNGCRVLSYAQALAVAGLNVCVAFADPKLRRVKYEQARRDGLTPFSIFAPSFIHYDGVEIGSGAIFADHTMVTANATIGRSFHCNIYSYVAHDCVVGDFVTLGPRVSLNGHIVVEDEVYIGSDATILPGSADKPLTIGTGAVIGAGSLVTKDVAPGTTVVGVPAKPIKS